MYAELLEEYEAERERILAEPTSAFRDKLLHNLEDAIEVLKGNPLPDRSHKSKAMAADWLDQVGNVQGMVVESTEDEEYRDPRLARLTPRQMEILELVAQGFGYRETGRILGISGATVQKIVSRVRRYAQRK